MAETGTVRSDAVRSEVRFEAVSRNIGAWVRGFELGAPDNALLKERLQRALAEHGVLFFDFGRVPDFEEYFDFASLFGNVQGKFDQVVKNRKGEATPFID